MKRILKKDGFCAPAALAYVSGLPEKTVLDICVHEGFDPFHGMDDAEILAAAKELGIKLRPVKCQPQRLRKFIKDHKFGRYLVCTWDHIFVLNDGLIYDPLCPTGGLGRVVQIAWRVVV